MNKDQSGTRTGRPLKKMFTPCMNHTANTGGGQKLVDISAHFWERLVEVAKQQPGFVGALLLTDRETGDTSSVTMWSSKAEMEAAEANEEFRDEIEAYVSLFPDRVRFRHGESKLLSALYPGGIELDVHASCFPESGLSLKWSAR